MSDCNLPSNPSHTQEVRITVAIIAEYAGPWPGVGETYNVIAPFYGGPGTTIIVRPGIDTLEAKVTEVFRRYGWSVS